MRWVAGIIGILGALAGGGLGMLWLSDWISVPEGVTALAVMAVPWLKTATFLLIACGVVGIVLSVLVILRKAHAVTNALLLMVCGVLPIFFYVKALWGVPMTLAGLLALFVRYGEASRDSRR